LQKFSVIIDPGDEPEKIINYISISSFNPVAIINTHAHFDHTGAVSVLKNKYKIPFYLHSADRRLLQYLNFYRKLIFQGEPVEVPSADYFLDEMEELIISDFRFEIIHSPGHTKGSVCLLIDNFLFTGDTLLKNNIGNLNFPESNRNELFNSLKILATLDEKIIIYPGHGESSRLGKELANNRKLIEVINSK